MTKLPNPINESFRAVLRDPALLLIEVVWRWSFGAMALLFLLLPTLSLLGSIKITDVDLAGWRSNDPTRMAEALVNILAESGSAILRVAAWVLPAVTLLWVVIGAAGRAATIGRMGKGSPRLGSVLALHCARALVGWLAATGLVAAIWFDANVSTRGAQTDVFLYYALVFWSFVLIGGAWAVTNWYLSLAPLCALNTDAGFLASTWKAVRLARKQSGDLGGISLIVMLYRLVALAIAFVLCALPSSLMGTWPRTYAAWVVAVSLAYFVIADFLYLARMVAYLKTVSPKTEFAQQGTAPSWSAEGTATP
jgi:hypothetical protein